MKRKIPPKEKRKQKKKKASKDVPSSPQTYHHAFYGQIPIIVEDGISRCDPDFQPKLPRGAVRGNVQEQEFCSWCHFPQYFYVDQPKQCKDCGKDFVFSAKEQKYWYEVRKFNFYSKPIRCLNCRQQQRRERALRDRMTAVAQAIKDMPDDPHTLLLYAETVSQYHDYFGQGNLNRAIAAARHAYQLLPPLAEALFWEATCLDAAGHFRKAQQIYEQFLVEAKHIHRCKPYKSSVEQRLLELERFSDEESHEDETSSL